MRLLLNFEADFKVLLRIVRFINTYIMWPLLLVLGCVPEQDVIEVNPFVISEGSRPWVIAHGGSKALWPENTMMAFDSSMALGVDALEMDVQLTNDGILVLHHDQTIDRMSDGEGLVVDYTLAELGQFNFGFDFVDINGSRPYSKTKVEISTLEQLVSKYSEIPLIIEIKNAGADGRKAAEELKRVIDEHKIRGHTIVASFHDEVLDHYLDIMDKAYFVSTAAKESRKLVLSTKTGFGIFYKPEAVAAQLPMESSGFDLTKPRIAISAHRHNMALHYWTINEIEDMKKLILVGADGLMTDRPDLMIDLLNKLGY